MFDLTVVIPSYNKAPYIVRALESVINQSVPPMEVIVVDDGSNDDTVEIIKSNPIFSKVKILGKENGGVSSARNLGYYNANTRYVAFLDADDEYEYSFLEKIQELMLKFPGSGVYATNFKLSPSEPSREEEFVESLDFVREYLKKGPPFCSSSIVLDKKKLILDGDELFPVGVSMGEDVYCWLKIYSLGNTISYSNYKGAIYHSDDMFSCMNKREPKPIPYILSQRDLLSRFNSSIRSMIEISLSEDYIKSNILFGKKKDVFFFILRSGHGRLFLYTPFFLVPKKLIQLAVMFKNKL